MRNYLTGDPKCPYVWTAICISADGFEEQVDVRAYASGEAERLVLAVLAADYAEGMEIESLFQR